MLLAAGDLPARADYVDLFVALAAPDHSRTGFDLAREARRAGLQAQVELSGRSLKGQLKHADRIGARYVAIVGNGTPETAGADSAPGGEPPAGPRVSLKDMESGTQKDTNPDNVIPTILRGHRL
jgi:histidyl-tRNA synthetase